MSHVYTIDHPDTGRIEYRDKKRGWWLMSVSYPLIPFVGIALQAWTGSELALLVPLLMIYVVVPAIDWFWGEDEDNPPEALVAQLDADKYYRILTYITVPLHFVTLIGCAAWIATHDLSWWSFLALAVTAGAADGFGINTGHELGHKKSELERWLAKIVLAVPVYGHFWIEHNRGHHRDVATPEDPASSRMGETIYRFALREIPGAFKRAWSLEKERLARVGKSVWSFDNEILHSYLISAVLQIALIAAFGWIMVPFLIVHNCFAWWQLTSANYIEHYGLLRAKQPNGKYERCQPYHSWNANHTYSNLITFQLQRHSDHHANPTRRYQTLRNFDDLPRLPSGYFGMFCVAYVPWLWFRVMNPRVLRLPHINGDLSKVNVDPVKRDSIVRRHGIARIQSLVA